MTANPWDAPLAWLLLAHHRGRFLLAVARIAFAVVVMFTQRGFLTGVYDSQTALLRSLNADLVIVSPLRASLTMEQEFPRRRLYQALTVPGVTAAYPLVVREEASAWKNPVSGHEAPVRVLGFDPRDPVFAHAEIEGCRHLLEGAECAAFDARSRGHLGAIEVGTATELNRRRLRVAALFTLGPDFRYDGNVVMSHTNLLRHFPEARAGDVSLGVLRVEKGADATEVCRRLNEALPPDVQVFTREDMVRREEAYWARITPTGIIFRIGVAVGFLVGLITCYQILFSGVRDHLPQFATLRAMGFHDVALARIVLAKALILGVAGFTIGLAASFVIYGLLRAETGLRIDTSLESALVVGGLTLAMSLVAGMAALRKALRADPAELF